LDHRVEKDSLGSIEVPAEAYWGINTARAMRNFPISGRKVHRAIIRSYCHIKTAAAVANAEGGRLPRAKSDAVVKAAGEVLAGKLSDQFPVDIFQAGAGTSTNMNVNEVLCNRALELLGREKGDYAFLHPNDHVNMGQSTNDTYPTAMHLAALAGLAALYPETHRLRESLEKLGAGLADVLKSGRTHLQDAVPVTLGGEFNAYAAAIRSASYNIHRAAEDLLELGIGGSAAGTGMNTHPAYAGRVVEELAARTGLPLRKAPDLVKAMQSQAPAARVSSALRDFAVELGRIANDLRLLSSGPATGLAEIRLPAVQAGSSIMPGKVNPSIPEMVNMVCFQVIGNDLIVSQAAAAGQLELNVMMPVMAENILESIEILGSACRRLAEGCVDGITVDAARCRDFATRSSGLATALAPFIGYHAAAEVVRRAAAGGKSILETVRESNLLSEKELEKILDPARMTRPDPDLPKKR